MTRIAALCLVATPIAAAAQTPDPDVKCMLTSNVFAMKETDAKRRQIATLAVTYYLGRIEAKLSPAQFRASVLLLGRQQMGQDIGVLMTNCARAMQAKQAETAQMLQQVARAAAQPK